MKDKSQKKKKMYRYKSYAKYFVHFWACAGE